MRPYTRTIANNATTSIAARGRTVFIDSSTAAVQITVRKDETGRGEGLDVGPIEMSARQKLRTVDVFDQVVIFNQSGVSVDIVLLIGYADFDAPLSEVGIEAATAIETVGDVTCGAAATTILAADATRKRAHIKALAGNAVNVRIGDNANVGAARGVQLQPGEGITINGQGEISGIQEAVGASDVSVTVETRP